MLRVNTRVTMCSRVLVRLIGVVYIYYQVLAADDNNVYVAELMVESNITLNTQTLLSVLNGTPDLQLNRNGASHTVALSVTELVAECLIIGNDISCNCSEGYIWSNTVCYDHNCCNETTCKNNVSHITPLCISKVKVRINGSVILKASTWKSENTNELKTAFGQLNGFENLNVTGQRQDNRIADFEAAVSIKFATSKLQDIVKDVETKLEAVLLVDTEGMVTMEAPGTSLCYLSPAMLKCLFEEATGSAGWNMSKKNERFELNNGNIVTLNHACSTNEYPSCVAVTIKEMTGLWEGTYECGFAIGSIRHTAKKQLKVVLLPDEINMKIEPLTADCSDKQQVDIKVTATILNSTESFEVYWDYRGNKKEVHNRSDGDYLVYEFTVHVSCQKTTKAQFVEVSFKNWKGQVKTSKVDIPVIYEGAKFCDEDTLHEDVWPKTPSGDTVINPNCAEGRVGYKSRTCQGTTWQEVFSYCVNKELNKVVNAADNFIKGLGATQKVAIDIFEGLKNESTSPSDSTDSIADISASINVLSVMANASENVDLEEGVLPDFVIAASNMLNKTWDKVNVSVVQSMSSNYLLSVEHLVKNIKVNNSNGLGSQNLDLNFCSSSDCNVSVFDIGVNLNKTSGIMKTVAVKNLISKLRNNFGGAVPTSLLISVILKDNNDSSLKIRLDFPKEQQHRNEHYCVFWNTTERDWSDTGCIVKTSDENHTLCECNHLTSFSVLMAKNDISNEILDIITIVGLSLSIFSLLIFLIIEFLVWSAVVKSNLSHFRHTALVNIAIFLLLADCCFMASSSPETLSDTLCLVFTVCKHLFFLAMFSWTLCMSIMLVHQLIFVFSPLRKRVFMFFSSVIGYVCPILIVGSSYIYCKYTNKSYYNQDTCWLVFDRILEGSMHAFILPVGTVILTNLFSMVVVIVTLFKSSVPEHNKADDKDTVKSILKVVIFLTPVFGLTWIIGFALLNMDGNSTLYTVANYSFTILNSFQGFLLLLTGCFAEQRVREEVFKIIMAKSNGKDASTTVLTSATYTKDK